MCTIDYDQLERQAHNQRERRRYGTKRYPCPTCGREGALSAAEHAKGYQCRRCADREESAY